MHWVVLVFASILYGLIMGELVEIPLRDDEKAEFRRFPWSNPENRIEMYFYKKNCDNFNCPPGLVCAQLGSRKRYFKYPVGCMDPSTLCREDEVKNNFF